MNLPAEIEAVRQCLLADLPQLDAAEHAAARERALRSAPRLHADRRTSRWPRAGLRVALVGVLAAVAVTVAIALVGGREGSVQAPFRLPSAAAAILNRVATHLAAGGALRGTQARVIREDMVQLVGSPGKDGRIYYYVLPRTMESGFDALGNWFYEELPDGRPRFADPAAEAAFVRAVGPYVAVPPKPRLEEHSSADSPNPNFLNFSARQVMTLPTDPGALKARLLSQAPVLASQSEPHRLVDLASRLLTFGPTPPAVQAALARLLAALPGVHRAGTVWIGGHPADVLAFPGATRLAFDRGTGQLLEEIDALGHRSSGYPGLRPGSVVDVIAFTTRIASTIDTPITVPAVAPVAAPTAPASPAIIPRPVSHRCRPPLPGYTTDARVYAVHRAGSSVSVELQQVKADCEGHGRFGVSPAGLRYTARLSPAATVNMFSRTGPALRRATIGQLEYGLAHPSQYGWFDGAVFAIKTAQSGEITGLVQLFHL